MFFPLFNVNIGIGEMGTAKLTCPEAEYREHPGQAESAL